MPTLTEVLTLSLEVPNMQLHIEMKGPAENKEAIAKYNYRLATEMTRDLIDNYQI